ncbi:MAG TPA: hypothetical protein VGA81_05095 [Methylomirabilota bacterium]
MADDIEDWFERGVTDGLPEVPPTRERVERMLSATSRPRDTLVAEVPPPNARGPQPQASMASARSGGT